ncbi:MAG: hypothetical protein K2P17_01975 [Helicobacteraceae bacterium]|nr:hypothetical protein [Helicobacteraceae bacterium]
MSFVLESKRLTSKEKVDFSFTSLCSEVYKWQCQADNLTSFALCASSLIDIWIHKALISLHRNAIVRIGIKNKQSNHSSDCIFIFNLLIIKS